MIGWAYTATMMMIIGLLSGLAPAACQQQLGQWRYGRATFFGSDSWSINTGSCGYGTLYQDEPLGWNIVALPDVDPAYMDSCGRCVEVACNPITVQDSMGASFDRNTACMNAANSTGASPSVVVRVTDTCPCNFQDNPSNRRWCCGDQGHLDMSVWAWERLADKKWGVIGVRYRPVPCDYQPERVAAPSPNPTPAKDALTAGKRVARDWPEFWPGTVNPQVIYQGSLRPTWTDQSNKAGGPPGTSMQALDGTGMAMCLQPQGAYSLVSRPGAFQNRISLTLWLYVGDDSGERSGVVARRSLTVAIGGPQVKGTGFRPTSQFATTYWWRFEIFLNAFAGAGPISSINLPQQFKGCGGMDANTLTTVEFRNPSPTQPACIDHMQLA